MISSLDTKFLSLEKSWYFIGDYILNGISFLPDMFSSTSLIDVKSEEANAVACVPGGIVCNGKVLAAIPFAAPPLKLRANNPASYTVY